MAGAPHGTFDADSHVLEPLDTWVEHIDPALRDRALRCVEVDGIQTLVIDRDTVIMGGGMAGLGGSHVERSRLMTGGLRYEDGCLPASYDPKARLALLDEWGVDRTLVFPTLGILWVLSDPALAAAHVRAYNRWIAGFAAETGGRVLPVGHLDLLDPAAAEREVEVALAEGCRAFFVAPELHGGRRIGDPAHDGVLARIAEAGVPLCLHVVVRFNGTGMQSLAGWYTPENPSPGSLLFGFSLGATMQIVPALTTLVTDGTFDRHPSLKVLNVEAGCGWAGYLMDRMDEKYEHLGWMSPLKEKPSHYLAHNCWYVAEPDERGIGAQLAQVGPDRILWGSDFPHVDSAMDPHTRIDAAVAGLEAGRRSAVLTGNADRLFPR